MPDITKNERGVLSVIETLTDPEKLRSIIENSRKQNSTIVERAAFLKLCQVQPEKNPGTVEYDVWQSIYALEEMLRIERGKTVRLSRTRQKITRDGEAKTASDLTLKSGASAGFLDLIERGYPELTFEAIVIRHPKTFSKVAIDAARLRLASVGVDPDEFSNPARGD